MIRVAIVEDNEDNRLLLRALLEGEFEVAEYVDGPSAVAGIRAAVPDVVLLDISLPHMDGCQVLRALRDDTATQAVPVVALTAHAMSGDRERFLEMGFDAYITKPIVDEGVLFEAVRRLTTRSTSR